MEPSDLSIVDEAGHTLVMTAVISNRCDNLMCLLTMPVCNINAQNHKVTQTGEEVRGGGGDEEGLNGEEVRGGAGDEEGLNGEVLRMKQWYMHNGRRPRKEDCGRHCEWAKEWIKNGKEEWQIMGNGGNHYWVE